MILRIGRTIVAVLLALSVATPPATVGIAAGARTAAEMSVTKAMPDCDHRHHIAPGNKTEKSAYDCASLAGCSLKCFNFTGVAFSGVIFSSPASAALRPVRTSTNVSSQMNSPPFRPPRAWSLAS
jgi:hypothetical protein